MMPKIMGILNCTPDSFHDGRPETAGRRIERGLELAAEGADIIDVGGESTRPGAAVVPEAEELDRVLPVIEGLAGRTRAIVSVDTRKAAVARAAVAAGAGMVNDVSACAEPGMGEFVAATPGLRVVLMHMQGEPATMQAAPRYGDVLAEVTSFLEERSDALMALGVGRERIAWDPGIGFGKTLEHNLALIRGLGTLAGHGHEVCLGLSRKRMIVALSPDTARTTADRLPGSLAPLIHAWKCGVGILRVHDVAATRQFLDVAKAVEGL